jgi:hypothetical protein
MTYPERFGQPYPKQLIGLNVTTGGENRAYHVGHESNLTGISDDNIGEVYAWTLDVPVPCGHCGAPLTSSANQTLRPPHQHGTPRSGVSR